MPVSATTPWERSASIHRSATALFSTGRKTLRSSEAPQTSGPPASVDPPSRDWSPVPAPSRAALAAGRPTSKYPACHVGEPDRSPDTLSDRGSSPVSRPPSRGRGSKSSAEVMEVARSDRSAVRRSRFSSEAARSGTTNFSEHLSDYPPVVAIQVQEWDALGEAVRDGIYGVSCRNPFELR